MTICAIFGCRTRSDSSAIEDKAQPHIGLFSLPAVIKNQCERTRLLSEQRRSVWLARINRKDLKNDKYVRVCGLHFVKGKPANLMDDGNPDWAPSLRLGHGRYDRTTVVASARYMRCKRRQQNKPHAAAVCKQPVRPVTPPEHAIGSELEPDELTPMGPILESTTTTEEEVQTELTCRDLQLLEDYRKLSVELATVKQQKEEMEMLEASLREDPNKVSFYTVVMAPGSIFPCSVEANLVATTAKVDTANEEFQNKGVSVTRHNNALVTLNIDNEATATTAFADMETIGHDDQSILTNLAANKVKVQLEPKPPVLKDGVETHHTTVRCTRVAVDGTLARKVVHAFINILK
ncbi:uncharacterized protein LOC142575627 [Dermacentor variabilis]|uniref:uncharacterized protein LOC142575627 n=1 Tax=Dermacentor variabilis TaxID=34621 RepID=UPI003F5C796E